MTNQEALSRAIETAVKNGYRGVYGTFNPRILLSHIDDRGRLRDEYGLIFSHEFAKNLWGEFPSHDGTDVRESPLYKASVAGDRSFKFQLDKLPPVWQYHLQQMVIAENPLAYLAENLPVTKEDETTA